MCLQLMQICYSSEEEGLAWGSAQVIGIAAIKNVGNMKEEQPGVSFPESKNALLPTFCLNFLLNISMLSLCFFERKSALDSLS